MGQHSQLGTIDPQFIISTPEGTRFAPAKAILNQFELAKQECRDTANLAAWMPILRSYIPGLLTQCVDSQQLGVRMVSRWLQEYMFAGDGDAENKANMIAEWFANYENFRSHGRRVGREQIVGMGVNVVELESDSQLQDGVLSVYHSTAHTFSGGTQAVKIIENHNGRAWVRIGGQVVIPAPLVPSPVTPTPVTPPPSNRAARRRAKQGR